MKHRWEAFGLGALIEAIGGIAIAQPGWRWLGFVIALLALAPLAYGLPGVVRSVRGALQQRPKWVTLSDATRYVSDESVWTRRHEPNSVHWVTAIRRDFLDALGTGEVKSRGRRPMNVSRQSIFGLEAIPIEFWPRAQFVAMTAWMKSEDADKVWGPKDSNYELGYVDVELHWSDVRRTWRPLPLWQRDKLTPFKVALAVEENSRRPVGVGHP